MIALLSMAALLSAQAAPPPPEIYRDVRIMTLGGAGTDHGPGPGLMDKDGDGFVSRDEFTGPTTDAFRILDANGDGRISPDEFQAGRAAAHVILGGPGGRPGGPDGGDRMMMMHGFGQGMAPGGMGPGMPPPPGGRLEIDEVGGPAGAPGGLDTDHDGKVSEEEFLAPLRDAFQRLDADHSGALEEGERAHGPNVRVISRTQDGPGR